MKKHITIKASLLEEAKKQRQKEGSDLTIRAFYEKIFEIGLKKIKKN